MVSTESGKWLQDALIDLCSKVESGLQLDHDVITGLVSYCELAAPEDANEYLTVVMTEKEAAEMETQSSILRPTFNSQDKTCNRIKANPNIRDLPVFVDTHESGRAKTSQPYKNGKMPVRSQTGVCFEISGRVQHDDPVVEALSSGGFKAETPVEGPWKAPKVNMQFCDPEGENNECLS